MMAKRRGVRLPFLYFFNCHLFDILNGTDTHTWLPKDFYQTKPLNFNHGVLYMCSWTSEIRNSFNELRLRGVRLDEYTFVDIGCGKGKVVLEWARLLGKYGYERRVVGIDYSPELIEIARSNCEKLFGHAGDFIIADATNVDYAAFGERLIIYLYNPFDDVMLGRALDKITTGDVWVIYNNPVHSVELLNRGFGLISERLGFHPNGRTSVFRRTRFNDGAAENTGGVFLVRR
jgi:SAM-dependent methyltransferase